MNITQALFIAEDFDEARTLIKKQYHCQSVQPACLTTISSDKMYVLTENADIFFLKQYNDGVFVTKRNYETRPFADNRPRVRLALEPKHETQVDVARLVWCTFVTKEWDNNLYPTPKNGNTQDVRLSNLQCNGTQASLFSMPNYSGDIYNTYFKDYCHYCERLHFNIDQQDAKDIVSNSFMECIARCDCAEKLRINWKLTVRNRVLDYYYRQVKHVPFEEDLMQPSYITTPEIDFSLLCHRPSERAVVRAIQDGYSISDYAELNGKKRSSVSSNLTRGIQEIQRKLAI